FALFVLPLQRRPPPRSTLFPYTTLFRSTGFLEKLEEALPGRRVDVTIALLGGVPPRGVEEYGLVGKPPVAVAGAADAAHGLTAEDRKSTRLNSSHDQISYAVFCLKKKTT